DVPSQCSVVGLAWKFTYLAPTAQASFAAMAATPQRSAEGSAVGTTAQLEPSQCRASPSLPVAHTSSAVAAATAWSAPCTGSAGGAIFQAVPSQCSISGRMSFPAMALPTDQTSSGATAATPSSDVLGARSRGVGTTFHEVPSQCSASVRPVKESETRPT